MLPKGSKLLICLKGLHPLIGDNVWIRPSDGSRYCRACRNESRRSQYAAKVQEAEAQRKLDDPNYRSKSDKKRYNQERRAAISKQAYEAGYEAFSQEHTRRKDFPRDFKPYTQDWYNQRDSYREGWDDAKDGSLMRLDEPEPNTDENQS